MIGLGVLFFGFIFWGMYQISLAEIQYFDLLEEMNKKIVYKPKDEK
jgi:hypothetical protein